MITGLAKLLCMFSALNSLWLDTCAIKDFIHSFIHSNNHLTRHVHIIGVRTMFSCNDDKNNLQALFNFSTKVIKHTVKPFYCCEILFVTSYIVGLLKFQLSFSINQILFT